MARTPTSSPAIDAASDTTPLVEPARQREASINRVILVGRLTADPQLRFTQTGLTVAHLRLATNDRDQTEFHDVVAWRRLAEVAGLYLGKGRRIYVEGRLHGRTWQAQDGTTRRGVEVVAERLQILSARPASRS